MAISFAVNCCKPPFKVVENFDSELTVKEKETLTHQVARAADLLVAIAAVIMGILGIVGVIGMPLAAAYTLMAVGGTFITLSLFSMLQGCRAKYMLKMAERKEAYSAF